MIGRKLGLTILAATLAAAVIAGFGYRNATALPVVRHLTIEVPDYPPGAAPVRIALLSDIHVQGPGMPPGRVRRIVEQVNGLRPDLDLIAGDYLGTSPIGRRYSLVEAVDPLGGLKAKYGVFGILGNNDAQASQFSAALRARGIRLLMNEAVQAGPVALGGLDGRLAHSDPQAIRLARRATYEALERIRGPAILIAHRPDEFESAPPFVQLVVAGHTHCGQIVLPLAGALMTGSDFGEKYICGVHRRGSSLLVVTAGLGTSHVPLRFGAPPDIWLISITSAGGPR